MDGLYVYRLMRCSGVDKVGASMLPRSVSRRVIPYRLPNLSIKQGSVLEQKHILVYRGMYQDTRTPARPMRCEMPLQVSLDDRSRTYLPPAYLRGLHQAETFRTFLRHNLSATIRSVKCQQTLVLSYRVSTPSGPNITERKPSPLPILRD